MNIHIKLCAFALVTVLMHPILAQDVAVRAEAMDANGMYKQVLALCLDEGADSPVALFLAAEYYNEGRTGIERDTKKGREYYVKALNAYRPAVEAGDLNASDKYRFARCIEFGLGKPGDAKEWYVVAADEGNTNAMRRVMAYWESEGGIGDIPKCVEEVPEIWTTDARAKYGARLYEKDETREKGLAFLREAAQEGSPFAMARLSALYYLGEGGVEKDLGMARQLMKAAVAKGFPENQLPIEQIQKEYDSLVGKTDGEKAGKNAPPAMPGDGFPGRLEKYDVTPELKRQLERFSLAAGWFRRDKSALDMLKPHELELLPANEIPYLLFTPKRGAKPSLCSDTIELMILAKYVIVVVPGLDAEGYLAWGAGPYVWLYDSTTLQKVLPHELGHTMGLEDEYTPGPNGTNVSGKDKDNLMNNLAGSRLRYGQWKTANSVQNE